MESDPVWIHVLDSGGWTGGDQDESFPNIYNISKQNPPPGNSLAGGRSQQGAEPVSSGIVVPEGVDDPAQGPWRGPHTTPSALSRSQRLEGNLVSSRPTRGCAIQAPLCFLLLLSSDLIKRSITRLWWTDNAGFMFYSFQNFISNPDVPESSPGWIQGFPQDDGFSDLKG